MVYPVFMRNVPCHIGTIDQLEENTDTGCHVSLQGVC